MRKKSSNSYFTQSTEDYIVEYNNSKDPVYRAKVFTDHIYQPFYKLAENIIHTFKFYHTDVDQLEDLKHEIVSMLLEDKISKFNPAIGAKAYSYFGTIVKRWLISYNNSNYRRKKQTDSLDNTDSFYEEVVEHVNPGAITLTQYIDLWIEEVTPLLPTLFPKVTELEIAEAIVTVFRARQDLDIFRKKALYIYIREITNCETPYLTKVVAVLKAHFYKGYVRLYEDGLLDIKSQ